MIIGMHSSQMLWRVKHHPLHGEYYNSFDYILSTFKFKVYKSHNPISFMLQHVIVRRTPWFVEEYGSLCVWSCQGMEHSHHAAKSAYQRHTQHSGGKTRKSALL
jgi:hypothetical protein